MKHLILILSITLTASFTLAGTGMKNSDCPLQDVANQSDRNNTDHLKLLYAQNSDTRNQSPKKVRGKTNGTK